MASSTEQVQQSLGARVASFYFRQTGSIAALTRRNKNLLPLMKSARNAQSVTHFPALLARKNNTRIFRCVYYVCIVAWELV